MSIPKHIQSLPASFMLVVFFGAGTLLHLWSEASADQHSSASAGNQVTLVYEGYVKPVEGRELVPGARDDGARLVASTMAVVKGQESLIFVDPGFIVDRSLILQSLAQLGVDPEDVTHTFISHHHPDHTVNAALFPNAVLVDFWATYKGDLWQDHGDNFEIDRGITVVRTPGHSSEDASLVVDTTLGKVVFTHVWWNETLFPPVDPIADDQQALEASRQLVRGIADCIVPGHGTKFVNPDRPQSSCAMVDGPPSPAGSGVAHGHDHDYGHHTHDG